MDENKGYFGLGLILGILIMIFLWLMIAKVTEMVKVKAGYLTYEGKIYRVEYVAKKEDLIKEKLNQTHR